MTMEIDYEKVVSELNAELYERFGETEMEFSHSTDGDVECISFEGITIWNSEMDVINWREAEFDHYFAPFIKRKFNAWVHKLYSLKF